MSTAPPVRQTDHVGIRVQNMEAALRFYHQTLGLPLSERKTMESGTELVFLKLGNAGCVELIGRPEGMRPAEPVPGGRAGLQHFCLEVEDVDAWLEYLAGQQVPITSGPFSFELPSASCRALFITDPDATPVELIERKPRSG
jgi:catechol 2,3-dioxygenase-like lactoylglutathione lyase family enzyme